MRLSANRIERRVLAQPRCQAICRRYSRGIDFNDRTASSDASLNRNLTPKGSHERRCGLGDETAVGQCLNDRRESLRGLRDASCPSQPQSHETASVSSKVSAETETVSR